MSLEEYQKKTKTKTTKERLKTEELQRKINPRKLVAEFRKEAKKKRKYEEEET